MHVNCRLLVHVSTPVVSFLDLPDTQKISARGDASSFRLQYRLILALDACMAALLQVPLVSGDAASIPCSFTLFRLDRTSDTKFLLYPGRERIVDVAL